MRDNTAARITKRQVRSRIFALRDMLKEYVRESGTKEIQKELMMLRSLAHQVTMELEKEQENA